MGRGVGRKVDKRVGLGDISGPVVGNGRSVWTLVGRGVAMGASTGAMTEGDVGPAIGETLGRYVRAGDTVNGNCDGRAPGANAGGVVGALVDGAVGRGVAFGPDGLKLGGPNVGAPAWEGCFVPTPPAGC